MMIGKYVLTSVVLGLGALMGRGDACSCSAQFQSICDHFGVADVVVHAKALTRSLPASVNDDVTYSINTLTMYKEDPDVVCAQLLQFSTKGNSGLCGIYMELGQEYLIDLVRDENDDLRAVGLCGAFRSWSEVTAPVMQLLEEGCENYNTCDNCSEFQECLGHLEGTDYQQFYCSDVCDPSPCAENEVCSLEAVCTSTEDDP